MATIRENGATRQSGAGFHARKGAPGRRRTRSAAMDSEIADQLGTVFRFGATLGAGTLEDRAEIAERYADWER